jgi:hypothetical protein
MFSIPTISFPYMSLGVITSKLETFACNDISGISYPEFESINFMISKVEF